jgi:hypothetical protein
VVHTRVPPVPTTPSHADLALLHAALGLPPDAALVTRTSADRSTYDPERPTI